MSNKRERHFWALRKHCASKPLKKDRQWKQEQSCNWSVTLACMMTKLQTGAMKLSRELGCQQRAGNTPASSPCKHNTRPVGNHQQAGKPCTLSLLHLHSKSPGCNPAPSHAGQGNQAKASFELCASCLQHAGMYLHPGLLMQVGHVELAAWRMGQQLVVLLQDLMKALHACKCA
eukprot:scaffold109086_cov17-Tisochrysis_lutea.AAC.1